MRSRVSLLFVLALVALSMMAQGRKPVGGGGIPTPRPTPSRDIPGFGTSSGRQVRVDIQVTDEGSRPLYDSQIMVELQPGGGAPQRSFVDSNGHSYFTVPSGMTYQVTVTGANIDPASASFQVDSNEMTHMESIAVRTKESATPRVPGGVVSASNLNIPAKARDEFSKGMKEMKASKWQDAKKHFEKAINEYPKYDWAYNNLAVVEIQLKNRDAATQDFAKAVEINDKNPDATANLGLIRFEDNDLQGAKELMKKSLTVRPNDPKSLTILALAQLKTGESAAALASAEKVHQGDLDHFPIAHFVAAQIREQMGDHAGAERQYQAYLKEAPDGPQASQAKDALVRIQAKK